MSKPIWSSSIRILGNLVPAIIALPFGVLAVLSFDVSKGVTGKTLGLLIAFPVVGWIAMNLFGLWANAAMRNAIARKLDRARPGTKQEHYFVGIARPGFRSALDPHEDVGFLIIADDHLEFFGDTLVLSISKSDIGGFRKRANIHTCVLAGGWIEVLAGMDTFRIEPRDSPILFVNSLFRNKLLRRLRFWLD